jgi:hypothetical protein
MSRHQSHKTCDAGTVDSAVDTLRRQLLTRTGVTLMAAGVAAQAPLAQAQSYPTKPIKVVVGYASWRAPWGRACPPAWGNR